MVNVVSIYMLRACVAQLAQCKRLSLDTETTGLRPYHGDRPFSVIIADSSNEYYFNFNPDPLIEDPLVLPPAAWPVLQELFSNPDIRWYMHHAKFDLAMLATVGCRINGPVWDTRVHARIEYNDHMDYSLDACAKRIGLSKDDAVMKYITENKLWEWEEIPGKKVRKKKLFFDKVPFELITEYGCKDARITYDLGLHQERTIGDSSVEAHEKNLPCVSALAAAERDLTRTISRMESVGLLIDRNYCVRASRYEDNRATAGEGEFAGLTGRVYQASPKLFAEVFASDKPRWEYTDKGNPSFDTDTLKKFDSPVARAVLSIRDAKSKADFYNGFLYHADANNRIHPNLDQAGTGSGRCSSSDPNLQNLTDEEPKDGQEFLVRRAIIPTPGYLFLLPDYEQTEYKLMLEMACILLGHETNLVRRIREEKLDVHQAIADEVCRRGGNITRSQAKNVNFAILYGAGVAKLADMLKSTENEARHIKNLVFEAAPEIRDFVRRVINTTEARGYVFNWAGRRSYFAKERAYKAPNYLIQGGCADMIKRAMVDIDEWLRGQDAKSRLLWQIHDELVVECHESETDWVPRGVAARMEEAFDAKHLPQTISMEYSRLSLADKTKGYP